MAKKKYKYSIEIEIECNTPSGFIKSLEDVINDIKAGNSYGLSHTDKERYIYHILKEKKP